MLHRSLACTALFGGALAAAATPAAAQFVEPDVSVGYSLTGDTATEGFGWVGEVIGDLDGDGAAEFVIGAPFSAAGGVSSGRAYVHSGATGALVHIVTGAPGNRLGFSVAGVGDASGDGVPDYAVGGPGVPGGIGRVVLISGATHDVVWDVSGPPSAFFGFDLNKAGDVDCDGLGDVIVGANRDSGVAFTGGSATVLSGADGSVVWTRFGTQVFGFFGSGVSGVDDVDGDGVPDQVVAAFREGSHNQGRAHVLSGATGATLRELTPNGTGTQFGTFFVHDAGDVDGDGIRDIYIGDAGDGARTSTMSNVRVQGRAYIFSGATGERLRSMDGEHAGDGLGIGRGAGDLDGDGHADLVVAAWLESSAAFQGGKVYLVSGKNGHTLRTMTGNVFGGQLGFDVAAIGDVSGDGIPDYLITGNGIAHVVHGNAL